MVNRMQFYIDGAWVDPVVKKSTPVDVELHAVDHRKPLDFGANGRETKRSASILARKHRKMNPPYAGRRTAADAAHKVGGVKVARR